MLRIHVGGLGSNVREDDLKKTFDSPHLGSVESVEIIRTKGRSFAYLDFVPASDKGLAKLFSTYNGCMWKGGRLKLEKAKEHYLSRLQHEWEEEEAKLLASKLSAQNDVVDEGMSLKPKTGRDMEKVNLNIFFPKLRKVKPLPLKGSGKHKYSFQRVEVPPLPVNFCDCEEHAAPLESTVRTRTITRNNEEEACEVNEEELNLMKLVLEKILEENEKNPSKAIQNPNGDEAAKKTEFDANQWQAGDDFAEDQASDEDNLVINIVGLPAKKRNPLSVAVELLSKSAEEIHGNHQKKKAPPNKKRKQPDTMSNADDSVPSKRKMNKSSESVYEKKQQPLDIEPMDDDLGSSKKKSSWKDSVKKENPTFRISDILSNLIPQDKESDHNDYDNASKEDAPSEKSGDLQEQKTTASATAATTTTTTDERYARGTAWLQKSSWLQLIADANKSSFSIAHVLPGATFQNQALQESKKNPEIVLNGAPMPHDASTEETTRVDTVDSRGHEENEGTDVKEEASSYVGRGGVVISETCPFMRDAASVREWAKAKAALSGSNRNTKKTFW